MIEEASKNIICKLANEGKTIREIATKLGYSEYQIRKYVKDNNIKVYSKKNKNIWRLIR